MLQRSESHARLVVGILVLMACGWVAAETDASPIVAGELVFVEVYRRPELSSTTQVDANGNITIAHCGNVKVAGLSEKEASAQVATALKRILKNPRVTVSRTVSRAMMGTRTADMTTEVINLNNSSAETLYDALSGMSTDGGALGFDPSSNSLIITDTPGAVQNMLAVVDQLDRLQSRLTQVRIATKIAEVKQGAMKELGIRWFVQGKEGAVGWYPPRSQDPRVTDKRGQYDPMANERIGAGHGRGRTTSGFDREFVEEGVFDRRMQVPVHVPSVGQMFLGYMNVHVDIGAMLDALVAEDQAETLASPSILAVNHRTSVIKMADEYPFTEVTTYAYGAQGSTRFMDFGIKMEVTPHVYRDSGGTYVQLELKPEVSFYNGSSAGKPIRAVRSSESVANVRDGQTLVIGGILMTDERTVVQRVPGLGRIPGIGNLFKHKERAKEHKELMVFVTPTVHESPDSITWDRMLDLSVARDQHAELMPALEPQRETRRD